MIIVDLMESKWTSNFLFFLFFPTIVRLDFIFFWVVALDWIYPLCFVYESMRHTNLRGWQNQVNTYLVFSSGWDGRSLKSACFRPSNETEKRWKQSHKSIQLKVREQTESDIAKLVPCLISMVFNVTPPPRLSSITREEMWRQQPWLLCKVHWPTISLPKTVQTRFLHRQSIPNSLATWKIRKKHRKNVS